MARFIKNNRIYFSILSVVFVITSFFVISLIYSPNFKYNEIQTVKGAGVTSTWIGGTTGNWSVAGNWDNGVPDATKDVIITSSTASITVTADADISFENLILGGDVTYNGILTLTNNIGTGTNIIIGDNGTLTQNNTSTQTITGDLTIESGGKLTHGNNSTAQLYIINFNVQGNIDVQSGASINVDYLGYDGGSDEYQPGEGPGGGGASYRSGAGGSHGAKAGYDSSYNNQSQVKEAYCNMADINTMGSGAGGDYASSGGAGGGLVILRATSTITINGTITANGGNTGGNGSGGGGSGGGIMIVADTVTGTPSITAIGGGSSKGGGGGAGGCVHIGYTTDNNISFNQVNLRGSYAGGQKGGAGQLFIKDSDSGNGSLYINNYGYSDPAYSPLLAGTPSTLDELYIDNYANYYASTSLSITNLTVSTTGSLIIPFGQVVTAANPVIGNGTGSIDVYGSFTPGAIIDGYVLKVYDGGTLNNLSTITVTDEAGLYLYGGSILSTTSLTSLISSGTLYLASSTLNNIDYLATTGTVSLYYPFFTGTLTDYIIDGGTVTMYSYTTSTDPFTLTNLTMNGGTLTHADNSTAQANIINISATGNITINAGSTISGDALGYDGRSGDYNGGYGPGGGGAGYRTGGGGAHGGNGGNNSSGLYGGVAYCTIDNPSTMGSGGGQGYSSTGGSGGGLIILQATSTITVDGTITADGGNTTGENKGSGGSGGGIKIVADTVTGTPSGFTVTGGNGQYNGTASGGGGGGCVYIGYTTSNSITYSQVNAKGSTTAGLITGSSGGIQKGGAGQVFMKDSDSGNGDLYVINNGLSNATYSPVLPGTPATLDSLYLDNAAVYYVSTTMSVTTSTITNSSSITIAAGKSITLTNDVVGDGKGRIDVYGTFAPGATIDGYILKIHDGGTISNGLTIDVTDDGSLYIYEGAVVSTTVLTSINSSGTLYITSSTIVSVNTLNIGGGNAFLYRNFTNTLTTFNINGGTATLYNYTTSTDPLILVDLTINGGVLTHAANTSSQAHIVNIEASNNITIESGGTINVAYKGYEEEEGPGPGIDNGQGSGGAHGGDGGASQNSASPGGTAYCTLENISSLSTMGSGGSNNTAGHGGGLVILNATETVTIDGTINAVGQNYTSYYNDEGGGGGGGIRITANIISADSPTINVNGGVGGRNGGGGGGGCVYILYSSSNNIGDGDVTRAGGGSASVGFAGSAGLFLAELSNTSPTVTALFPSQDTASTVTVTTTLADADSDVTLLSVEYSTDNATWYNATLTTVTQAGGDGDDGVVTSTGSITDIDTDGNGSIDLTIGWNIEADLPNTDDTSVYLRVVPNDGTASGTTATSPAFAIDTSDPTAPSALTDSTVNTTSITLTYPTTTSTDTNFNEYIIYYATTTPVTATGTPITSSTEADLGDSSFNEDTTTSVTSLTPNTPYYFEIFAYDTWSYSTSSASELTTTTAPAIPGAVTPTVMSVSQIDLAWSANNNPEGTVYQVYNVTDSSVVGTTTAVSYSVTALSANTSYVFKVRTQNISDITNYSDYTADTSAVFTLANAAGTPTVNNATTTTLDITIDTNSNPVATTYAVYNETDLNWLDSAGAVTTTCVYQTSTQWGVGGTITATGLNTSTVYQFSVIARNGSGTDAATSSLSNASSTLAVSAGTPTVNGNTITTLDVTLITNGNSATTTYAIYNNTDSNYIAEDGTDNGSTPVFQTSTEWGTGGVITITGLTTNTPHQFSVIAKNRDNVEAATSSLSNNTYTLAVQAGAPTVNGATTTTLDITIDTNGNPATTTYAIYNSIAGAWINTDGSSTVTPTYQTTTEWGSGGTITATDLNTSTVYQFSVIARNGSGTDAATSSLSNASSTLATIPISLALAAGSSNVITATWSGDDTRYYIENITKGTNSSWITGTSWSSNDLACGVTYSFRVKGRNTDTVESAWSSTVSATTNGCGGGGGGGSFASAPVSAVYDGGTLSEIGNTWSLRTIDAVNFIYDNTTHTLSVKSISASSAVITFQSTPQDVNLSIGESKNIDLDEDGTLDTTITLISISGSSVNVKLASYIPTETTTTPVETTPIITTPVVTTPVVTTPTVTTPTKSSYKFTQYLTVGSSGEEVKQLQLKLTELGYYDYSGGATGYFGNVTKVAVVKFQKANIKTLGLAPGFVGPGTRALLNKTVTVATTVTTPAVTTPAVTTPTVVKSTSGYTFKSFLTVGSKGEEVKQLQLKLIELGFYDYSGGATGYFGNVTKEAVSKFQQANISTIGSAPGFVGPGTRSVLNK